MTSLYSNALEPLFTKRDKDLFYKYLNKATIYFEYGSGGSTFQASTKNNILKLYSVESDITWHNKIKNLVTITHISFIHCEIGTLPNTFGAPGPNCIPEKRINYSNQISLLDKEESSKIDFVLIDGRFRVACCLKALQCINNDCFIAFDDFLNRPQYHIVLDYHDIIEKGENMVIFKKKRNVIIPDELIKKYELIQD